MRPAKTLTATPAPMAVGGMDMINHPPHYTHGEIECIDAMRAMLGREGFIAYLRGTILKYNWRILHKLNPHQDALKMRWYQDQLEQTLSVELG